MQFFSCFLCSSVPPREAPQFRDRHTDKENVAISSNEE